MKYKILGRSGLRVSELCLGAMTFGDRYDWTANKAESRKMFDAFADAGGNFIDTANRYTEGDSEKLVGEFVGSDRERFVIATKYSLSMDFADPNASGNHRKNLVRSLEASLKRLGTDYIDLYWIHAWDFTTPVDEVMRALEDVIRAGKVLHIGVSDAPAWVVARGNTISELRGWSQFVGLQIEYSLIERTPERELLPMADAFNMALLAWSPLGSGVLTGKFLEDGPAGDTRIKEGSRRLSERNLEIARTVVAVAEETGCSPAQVALNWIRRSGPLSIPIIGARNTEQLRDNLRCVDFDLSDAQKGRLDEVSRISLGFPLEFLAQPHIRRMVYGETFDRLEW